MGGSLRHRDFEAFGLVKTQEVIMAPDYRNEGH
jgi:hypothetical protein